MPRSIKAVPNLDRVTITLDVPSARNDWTTTVTAIGSSSTRRAHLWVRSEDFTRDHDTYEYDAAALVHHLALIAVADAPCTREQLDRQMDGLGEVQTGWWEQPELPLS